MERQYRCTRCGEWYLSNGATVTRPCACRRARTGKEYVKAIRRYAAWERYMRSLYADGCRAEDRG